MRVGAESPVQPSHPHSSATITLLRHSRTKYKVLRQDESFNSGRDHALLAYSDSTGLPIIDE